MKKILLIATAMFLLSNVVYSQCEPISTFPWSEGFENNGTNIPLCWTQSNHGWNWAVVPGSVGNPATAHEGNYKMQAFLSFFGLPVYTTRLITPVFDLTAVDNPVLRFWHTQIGQGHLSVSYRNSLNGEWTLLKRFAPWEFHNIPEWQETTILLPNVSDHYQIVFMATFLGGGTADVQLDDISIAESGTSNIPLHQASNFLLTPNPVRDFLNITRENAERTTITIYNSVGVLVHSYETYEVDFQINVSGFSSGVYFIRLSDNNRSVIQRFVKQ